MKKTFTLLMLTLFLSVLAFAQKRERPMPVKHQVPVSLLAKKNPKAALELNKVRTVPLDRQKAVSVSAKKAKKKAPKLAPAAGNCIVTLTAEDVWDDGSGYQMLLDADATAYGTIIPTSGALTSSGNVSDDVYNQFEYKIPENADGVLTTSNIVTDGNSVSIEIPAGTYDYCITNPTPLDRMWIASANGTAGGRYNDYVFEEGHEYEFYVSLGGNNDKVDVYLDGDKPEVPEEPTAIVPPAGLETSSWIFRAMSISYDEDYNESIEDYSTSVNVGFDGDDVYVQGLCSYVPDAWIKGTRSGDQVVFKTDQYFGYYWYDFFFVGYGANGFGDVTMTMNADENKLTTEEWVLISTAPSSGEAFFIFADVEILKPVEKAATPETPTIDQVSLSGSYPYMYATIPIFDTEGDPLIGDNLSYQLYTEINHEQQPFVLTPDNYIKLTEDMTIIPYNFADGYDILPGSQHQIYLNADDLALWNKVGIKAIYTGLGETHESEIFWYTIQEYPSHAVTIVESENGKVEADKESCPEADVVTLTVTPDEGYQLDALTVKDADGNDVKVTNNQFEMPLTDVTVTATFTLAPVDVDITVESGKDISAEVEAEANGAPIKNLAITLEEEGEYTISNSLTIQGGLLFIGNGATIDASGLTQPFIAFSKEPTITPVASGQYVIEDDIEIDNVIVNGLTKALFADNGKSYAYVNLSVKNSLFHYTTQGNVVFNFASSMAINFNILGCTFYSDAPGTGNFIAMSGKRPWQITGFESETGKFTCANNTFYNVAKSRQFMNTNSLKGQKYLYEFNSNIFVDVSNKKIYGNMTNNKKQLTTDGLNTYMFDGAFFNETNYNGDEGLQTDPGFADAASGDFTLAFTSEQWAQKTGDPRWIADDPTVMVAPESGDFAAIVAQAVKEGKETLALPAGAAYKAGSTVYVDKKLNIIGDESDPATLELGMKGFVIKDALDMENMIIDAATNAEPFIALSAEPNEELLGANNGSDYYNIMDPVILRNLTITGVKGKLIYDNNKKYALDNLLIENCIVQLRTPKDKKETVIYMQGGGIRMLEVNTSTFYQKGQGDNDYFVRYNNSARLDRMGYNKDMEAEDFVPEGFIYESNSFYKVAYEGQWGNYSGFNGQKYTAFTVNKNIWVDCGSGQIARRMLGSRGAEFYEVCDFDQNTYIYNGTAETEGTMKNGEPVGTYDLSGTAITKVPTFKLVATGDFTLDANDVQNKQQTGDPRWFAEEEATGIVNVNDNDNLNDNQNAPAYNLAGQRVNAQTAKGIIIKNGRKYVK